MVKATMPENFDRGAFGIERPGTYHLIVIVVDEYPKKRNGEPIPGWRITCGVLAGTEDCEKGKEVDLILRNPSASHNDGGKFCQKLQGRFLLVTGFVQENEAGKEIDINLEELAPGRQFLAKFSVQNKQNPTDAERIDLDYANLWHVDDAFVSEVPKDEPNLKNIPQELRLISGKDSKGPDPPTDGKAEKTSSSRSEPNQFSEPVKSGSGKPDYDSL